MTSETSTKTKTYSLNVSDRYVPGWTAWEVIREIVSNAMDTGKKWELTRHSDNHVTVFTPTIPRIGDMLVIGQGTKTAADDNIGQFGEGLKLAALATCRAGGTITIATPQGVMRFFLKSVEEFDDANILHCEHRSDPEGTNLKGCYVDIKLPDVGVVSDGRFLKDSTKTRIPKRSAQYLNLYLKGIWVSRSEEESIHDWNLHTCTINRDRSVVDRSSVEMEICQYLCQHMSVDHAMDLIQNQTSLESHSMRYEYFPHRNVMDCFKDAFHQIYGEKAVLASEGSQRADEYAVLKGYSVIYIKGSGLTKVMRGCPTSDDLLPKGGINPDTLERLRVHLSHPYIDEMKLILNRINAPVELCIFRDDSTLPDDFHGNVTGGGIGGVRIWIRKTVLDDSQKSFIESVLMFLSVARTTHPGLSLAFEGSMSSICAALATAWLEDNKR